MQELLPINILIADRTYRIRISPADEEMVRKTIKIINEKIIEFKTQFAGKDMQDYIAMVMVWFATQQTSGQQSLPEMADITEKVNRIETLLDNL